MLGKEKSIHFPLRRPKREKTKPGEGWVDEPSMEENVFCGGLRPLTYCLTALLFVVVLVASWSSESQMPENGEATECLFLPPFPANVESRIGGSLPETFVFLRWEPSGLVAKEIEWTAEIRTVIGRKCQQSFSLTSPFSAGYEFAVPLSSFLSNITDYDVSVFSKNDICGTVGVPSKRGPFFVADVVKKEFEA